jgi:hypothetical protein
MTDKVICITDFSALDTGDGGIPNSYLKDGDHNILRCHNCRIGLCDAWVTQPDLPLRSKVKAVCHKCGATSLEMKVNGKFHLGVTDDSNLVDIKYEYHDDPKDGVIVQNILVITKGK